MYYKIVYLAVSASDLYAFKKKVNVEQYYSIFKYSDILVSIKNIPGVHYSDIFGILESLKETGSVVVTFDLNTDKISRGLTLRNYFDLGIYPKVMNWLFSK
jgi:hypothetical protein